MKKFMLRISMIIFGMLVLASSSWAQTGIVVANINYDFVAGGKTHLAGNYRVYRLSPETLILQSEDTRTSFFLVPSTHHDPRDDQRSGMKLTLSGGVYYLSEVATDLGVYAFPAPRTLVRTANTKKLSGVAASGSN